MSQKSAIILDLATGSAISKPEPATPENPAADPSFNRGQASRNAVDDFSFEGDIPGSSLMDLAIKFLTDYGVPHRCYGRAHIKIGHVNYYPTTRSVCLDGQPKYKGRGLIFLLAVLKKEGYYQGDIPEGE